MSLIIELLDYVLGLIVREIGVDGARQTVQERVEIAAARAAADAEAAAKFGVAPKP